MRSGDGGWGPCTDYCTAVRYTYIQTTVLSSDCAPTTKQAIHASDVAAQHYSVVRTGTAVQPSCTNIKFSSCCHMSAVLYSRTVHRTQSQSRTHDTPHSTECPSMHCLSQAVLATGVPIIAGKLESEVQAATRAVRARARCICDPSAFTT